MHLPAVILAAGRGRRFAANGGRGPKALAAVGGTTPLLWTLDVLGSAGIRDAVVVLGCDGERIRRAVLARHSRPAVRFVTSDAWERTDSAYSFALGAAGQVGPVLLTYADVLVTPSLVCRMLEQGDADLLAVDATRSPAEWDMRAHVERGRVRQLGKTLPLGLSTGESACLFRFSDATRRTLVSAGHATLHQPGPVQFETMLGGLLDEIPVAPVWCGMREWCEVDVPAELEPAARLVAVGGGR
jgi:choline kinase